MCPSLTQVCELLEPCQRQLSSIYHGPYIYQHDTNDGLCLQTTTLASGLFEVQPEELLAVRTHASVVMCHALSDPQVCRGESSAEIPIGVDLSLLAQCRDAIAGPSAG